MRTKKTPPSRTKTAVPVPRETRPRVAKPAASSALTSTSADSVRKRTPRARAQSAISIVAEAQLLRVEPGLHNLTIAAFGETARPFTGVALPAVFVTVPDSGADEAIELIGARGNGAWIDAEGGTVTLRATAAGGHILLTRYCAPDGPAATPGIELRPADAATSVPAAAGSPPLRAEIVLHIEREGDRQFTVGGWAGRLGSRRRIEALAVRPLEAISHGEVEYKVYGAGGRETPWVSDGRLCGTRGQGLPLTGFAIRLAPHLRNGFDVIYRGAFFASGPAPAARNGEACFAPLRDDPLEAVEINIVERNG